MQTVSTQFEERAAGDVRPVSARFLAAFDKTFNSGTTFFTVGVSTVGGNDIIKGEGSVVQEWDKYVYTDYSDRIISIEWSRTQDRPYSVSQAIADIVVDNHDDFFSPSNTSDILPRRPVKLFSGFGTEDVPVFVGLTTTLPDIDDTAKTAKFHCIDFLSFLMDAPLDEAVLYQDETVDTIIGGLLELAGLTSTQYDLDVANTTIQFAFFDKGMKLKDAIAKLAQADLGSFYMTEDGVVRYRNRQNYDDTSVMTFDGDNTIDVENVGHDELINVVEVTSESRSVQENQKVWESTQSILVQAGQTVDVWADFQDPVTAVDTPVYIDTATTSLFTANLLDEGDGTPYTDIDLDTSYLFSKSYKMTFENTGVTDAYIRTIQVFGTPAKVTKKIYVREELESSIDKYDEQVLSIENEYIQDESTARSLALTLLGFYGDITEIKSLPVKGSPALQISDTVTLDVGVHDGDYVITDIKCQVAGGQFKQTITVKPRNEFSYFTIGTSTIGSSDVIAP